MPSALKKKYEQLKAKREAKQQQQQQQGAGDGAGGSGAGSASAGNGALSGILQQIEKTQSDEAKTDDRREPGAAVVKASALDRSAIEAFKAMRGPTGGEPPTGGDDDPTTRPACATKRETEGRKKNDDDAPKMSRESHRAKPRGRAS